MEPIVSENFLAGYWPYCREVTTRIFGASYWFKNLAAVLIRASVSRISRM
jgi:hypothetical protein